MAKTFRRSSEGKRVRENTRRIERQEREDREDEREGMPPLPEPFDLAADFALFCLEA